MIIKFSRQEVLQLGLVVCKHCGLPPNNHFNWGKKPCAHDKNCPGYEEKLKMGKLIRK